MNGATKGPSRQQEAQRYPHGEGGGNYPGILIIVIVVVIDELCVICLSMPNADADAISHSFPFRTTKFPAISCNKVSRHFVQQSFPPKITTKFPAISHPAICHHKVSRQNSSPRGVESSK